MRFHVTIMGGRPFEEIGETLVHGLRNLGYEVSARANSLVVGARNIVLGPHHFHGRDGLPESLILYNFEQLAGRGMVIEDQLARRFPLWDFSPRNVPFWKSLGYRAQHVPLGYVPQLTRIVSAPEQDIDVLFYGSLNPRRLKIIEGLQRDRELNVVCAIAYGTQRDAFIARAKVALNCHYYENCYQFESPRVTYLLANHKAVVSEVSVDFPAALTGAMPVVPYDQLVETCRELVRDADERARYERTGFDLFSKMREADILRAALVHTPMP